MKWNKVIKQQLEDYIQNPAVLMTSEEVPYEYRQTESSVNRLKRRRVETDIPYQLYSFIIESQVSLEQLREFASGLFLNYANTTGIYV